MNSVDLTPIHDVRQRQRNELKSLLGKGSVEERVKKDLQQARRPVMASYLNGPEELRALFKGKTLVAHVRRGGLISFRKKLYSSPSLAAAAACKRRTCNGWTFWRYERAPGDWVRLNELRK